MKKFVFIVLIVFAAFTAQAQLKNTNWKGAIKGDNPQNTELKFGKDTVVLYAADGSVIETMKFTVASGVVTLKKISGQSDCAVGVPGKYKFVITGSNAALTLVTDNCGDRSSALDKTKWVKAAH